MDLKMRETNQETSGGRKVQQNRKHWNRYYSRMLRFQMGFQKRENTGINRFLFDAQTTKNI